MSHQQSASDPPPQNGPEVHDFYHRSIEDGGGGTEIQTEPSFANRPSCSGNKFLANASTSQPDASTWLDSQTVAHKSSRQNSELSSSLGPKWTASEGKRQRKSTVRFGLDTEESPVKKKKGPRRKEKAAAVADEAPSPPVKAPRSTQKALKLNQKANTPEGDPQPVAETSERDTSHPETKSFTSIRKEKMAPGSQKRVKNHSFNWPFVIGSEAHRLTEEEKKERGVDPSHTHAWKVYVRGVPDGPRISAWLKKVQFKLHQTYQPATRVAEQEPFEVEETGWGGFVLDIRLHLHPLSGEKAAWRTHALQLLPYGSKEQQEEQEKQNLVRAEIRDIISFNEPTEQFWNHITSPGVLFAEDDMNGTTELPDRPTPGNPYSKQNESEIIAVLEQKEKEVEEELQRTIKQRGLTQKDLEAMRIAGFTKKK